MEPGQSCDDIFRMVPQCRSGLRKFPMFNTEAEQTLCYRWRFHRDISAAHQLVGNHLHLAGEIAGDYANCGIPLEELIGEGYVGLLRSVCRFDSGRGIRFTAYATWCVREAIHEYVVRATGMTLLQMAMFATLRDDLDHL